MPPNRQLLDELAEADEAGQVAYTRVLCESILKEFPDHGPTLLRYSRTLVELSLYEEAGAVLDHAERVVPEKQRPLVLAGRGHRLDFMGDFIGAERSRGRNISDFRRLCRLSAR